MTKTQPSWKIGLMVGLVGIVACAPAQHATVQHPFRRSSADIPVSLEVGTVRTPEFFVIPEAYFIMLQAEKRLPFRDLQCMLGIERTCVGESLIQLDWTVWSEGHRVAQGSSSGLGEAQYTAGYIIRFLGTFVGEAGKQYALEAKFTKDGTLLNVTNPHLIVVLVRYH